VKLQSGNGVGCAVIGKVVIEKPHKKSYKYLNIPYAVVREGGIVEQLNTLERTASACIGYHG
jgi:hypothetical protein